MNIQEKYRGHPSNTFKTLRNGKNVYCISRATTQLCPYGLSRKILDTIEKMQTGWVQQAGVDQGFHRTVAFQQSSPPERHLAAPRRCAIELRMDPLAREQHERCNLTLVTLVELLQMWPSSERCITAAYIGQKSDAYVPSRGFAVARSRSLNLDCLAAPRTAEVIPVAINITKIQTYVELTDLTELCQTPSGRDSPWTTTPNHWKHIFCRFKKL